MLQEIRFQVQVLKLCKSVQESSVKVLLIKARQLASTRLRELSESRGSTAVRQIGICRDL